jgi:zinc protease
VHLAEQFEYFDRFPVRQYRWDNGLEALLIHNPQAPVVAFLTQYTVGSASERDSERGLAHFFEHMMFRETAKLRDGDFDRIIAEAGGVGLNASTSYDSTQYYVNVPAASVPRIIEVEADRMVNLRLSADLIEKERGAVLGEMRMYEDMPSNQFYNALMAAAFKQHPYRHPIIGYAAQVAAFGTEDFARFYRAHYAPNRAVVTIAGGFDEAEALRLLDAAFGALPPGTARPAPQPADSGAAAPQRLDMAHDKVSSESLFIATHTPGLTHADAPALALLSAVLSDGRSAPLHRRMVLSGLATSASCGLMDVDYPLVSPGLFLVNASLQHGVPAERAEAVWDELLREYTEQGIAAPEFERARNQTRLGTYSSLQSNMGLARQLSGFQIACGEPRFGERLLERLMAVTPEDVRRVLETYLAAPGRITAIQRPARPGSAPAEG